MAVLLKVKPGVPMQMDDDDHPSFDAWMARVDRLLSNKTGVSAYDLPDCPYRDWYDSRLRPVRAANRALKRAGGDE